MSKCYQIPYWYCDSKTMTHYQWVIEPSLKIVDISNRMGSICRICKCQYWFKIRIGRSRWNFMFLGIGQWRHVSKTNPVRPISWEFLFSKFDFEWKKSCTFVVQSRKVGNYRHFYTVVLIPPNIGFLSTILPFGKITPFIAIADRMPL